MADISTGKRIHGLDALRAIAMLLGIVLHATIAYKVHAMPNWPHDDKFNYEGMDVLYSFIHSFRMPLFFLVAGYFARFSYYRSGSAGFIRARWKRIGIPFIVSLIIILPFTIFPFLVNTYMQRFPGNWDMIFEHSFRGLFQWNGMAHLWFLYYLLIYYAVALLIRYVRNKPVIGGVAHFAGTIASKLATNPWAILLLIIPVWLILLPVKEIYLPVDTGFIPGWPFLAFYGLFFFTGWIINATPSLFPWMVRRSFWLLLPAIGLFTILFMVEYGRLELREGTSAFIAIKALAACQIVCLVYGIAGLFLRYFRSEQKIWLYISDASYWMYLIHVALVAGFQVVFINSAVPGWMRFPIVLVTVLFITIVSYQFLVRYTLIGRYLHGPRHKREE